MIPFQKMNRDMTDPEAADLTQTVEEVRLKLESMKKLIAQKNADKGNESGNAERARSASIIDGTFLSAVFSVVLVLIVCVSFYAFKNLYHAIVKKFHLRHTEL